jgi:hypothetical protein
MPRSLQEFWDYVDAGGISKRVLKCKKCHAVLDTLDLEGNYLGYCQDCFFNSLGDELEKHPEGIAQRIKRSPKT